LALLQCGAGAFPLEPDMPSKFQQAAYPLVGIVAGAIIAYTLLYLCHVALAPVRQRNEAWIQIDAAGAEAPSAPRFPVNRDVLATDVAVVNQAARKIITMWSLAVKNNKPHEMRGPLYVAFQKACDELEVQAFVAGHDFQGKITFFSISTQITLLHLELDMGQKADETTFDDALKEMGALLKPVSEMLNKGLS
jgi:hypothetical protein